MTGIIASGARDSGASIMSSDEIEILCQAVLGGCRDPLVAKALLLVASKYEIDFYAEPSVWAEDHWEPLHDGQREVWISKWRIIAVFAGWQSGKTTIGPYWLRREIHMRGAGDYAVIAPHSPMLENKALPELKMVFHEPLWTFSGDKGGSFTMTREGELAYFGKPQLVPTRILCRHTQHVDAIEAFTAKGIWLEEPGQMPESIWPSVQARALHHQARILLTSRPYKHNWYVRDIWNICMVCYGDPDVDPWVRREDAPDDMGVVNFSTKDNPSPGNLAEYKKQKKLLPDWVFRLKYDGIPTRPVGQVYSSFRPMAQGDKPSSVVRFNDFFPGGLPAEWPVWVGVDFGKVHVAFVLIAEEMKMNNVGEWVSLAQPRYCVFKTYQSSMALTAAQHLKEAFRGLGQAYRFVNEQGVEEEGFRVTRKQVIAFGGSNSESGWRESYARWGLHIAEPPLGGAGSRGAQTLMAWTAFETGRLLVCDHEVEFMNDLAIFSHKLDPETDEPTEDYENEARFHRPAALRYICSAMPLDYEQISGSSKAPVYGLPDPRHVAQGSVHVQGIPDPPREVVPGYEPHEDEEEMSMEWPEDRNYIRLDSGA